MKRRTNIQRIEMFIDFPRVARRMYSSEMYDDDFADRSFIALRRISDFFDKYLPIYNALWTVDMKDTSPAKGGCIAYNNMNNWQEEVFKYRKNAESIEVELEFEKCPGKWLFSAYICVRPSLRWTHAMAGGKRIARIDIDAELWNMIDNTALLNQLRDMCDELGAYYACVDYECVCPRNLYSGFYRIYSDQGYQFDPESMLPGVYWLQYVPRSMFKDRTVIDRIKSIESVNVEEVGSNGVWIKLADSIDRLSYEGRLAFRDGVSDSLYPLSVLKMSKDSFLPIFQYHSNLIPLTSDEKKALKL